MKLEQYADLKKKIEDVRKNHSQIHVSILNKRKRIVEAPSQIIGVYSNFLCVESMVNSYLEKFTIQYCDLLTGSVEIKELL